MVPNIDPRGGVGQLIQIYSRHFPIFNVISTHTEGSGLLKSFYFILKLFRFVFTLVSNRKIKIIHIHGASYGSFYRKLIIFIIGKYLFKKKIIYHIHGAEFHLFYLKSNKLTQKLVTFFISNCNCVICLSNRWEQFFRDNFALKKVKILPNIIDYPVINKKKTEPLLISFLFLGYIGKRKGIFDLLNVIIENKNKYQGRIKLFIGGNGETQYLQDLINENNIENIVEFLGWVNNEKKMELFNTTNIYVLPSYNEGLPISILEAMSYGNAIISTPVGGIPEIVKNKENGLLIAPGDSEQLKLALDFFIENPELIQRYGDTSKKLVRKHLPDSVLQQLITIYKSILNE